MLLLPLLAKPLNPQQACLSQQTVPPAPPTTFHKHVNLIPITWSLYVLFPRPGMLFPSLLAKAAPLFSPKIQQKHYLFRASTPRPIPDCLPSHNHIDYFLVFIPTGHWGLRWALLCGLSPHEDVIHRGLEERVLWSLFCFPVPSLAPSLY